MKQPKLISNTKPAIAACLGAWYTWDRILQTSLEGLFTRDDHIEVDENNRSMRIRADDRYQEMPRQMKINIDRCTQVPLIDVETSDTRHFGFSRLKTQGQAKLRKCPDEFLTQ
ncbi:hypothetical protein DY000_02020247 [Brassica cretica]|uniref:Uncharacterized protein n=1 Tax=Brassica cretica TaxID=69181 RepID=A0ABQ7E9R1_BRACR|nr:hypothetical protein DY000_02020247 [Brassica cretica]